MKLSEASTYRTLHRNYCSEYATSRVPLSAGSARDRARRVDHKRGMATRTEQSVMIAFLEESAVIESEDPIHEVFGLSYGNYFVMHRTILQSMPVAWQWKLVGLLDEVNEALTKHGFEDLPSYDLTPLNADGDPIDEPIPHYNRGRTRLW